MIATAGCAADDGSRDEVRISAAIPSDSSLYPLDTGHPEGMDASRPIETA